MPLRISTSTLKTALKSLAKSLKLSSKHRGKRQKDRCSNQPLASSFFSPAFDLPALPDELWLLILRETTLIHPSPLLTHPASSLSFLDSTSPSPCDLAAYRLSLRTKRTLSLVSKEWNRRAQDYLYEFVWIRRAVQAKALARTLLTQGLVDGKQPSGRFIRRLHMETKALERCAVEDIRTILDYAPNLLIYSDHHAVRRNRFQEHTEDRCTPEKMFECLAHPGNRLKRLSWTNYEEGEVFPWHIAPVLQMTSASLEYLELSSSSMSSTTSSDLLPPKMVVSLPALRSLKVTLDNVTFAVLSDWEIPQLTNLSVLSSDFSYAGDGFAKFFHAHGHQLLQLELGHSSSLVEEHYLTPPPGTQAQGEKKGIPLADWCPNLEQFICSADAEWNWQTPDWIAPHVLLPTHPKLKLIGIRDIEKRLRWDAEGWAGGNGGDDMDDAPFFPLVEQLASLLRYEAFPELRFVRDLSRESHRMRAGRDPDLDYDVDPNIDLEINISGEGQAERDNPVEGRVLKFWGRVLAKCREREVWLEDWTGMNVTQRDLMRGWAGLDTFTMG